MLAPRLRPTSLQAFRFPLMTFAVALSALLALFAGCGLSTGGIPSADGGVACTDDKQCDDTNPCTTDTCGQGGLCVNAPVADGPAPAVDQLPGDCHVIVCMGGEHTLEIDDTDIPNSNNPCVKDECNQGMPLQDVTANDGHPCVLMGSPAACTNGMCTVSCKKAADCPDMGPCKNASCDGATGTCAYSDVSDGTPTPGVAPVTGDCVVHVCIGGVDTPEDDPSDVPAIPAAEAGCADQLCTAGTPSNPLHATDSVCSTYMGNMPGHCDAAGHCVECVTDGDCGGNSDDCGHPACVNELCTMAFTAAGTATSHAPLQQIPGDCHKIECDGNGGHNNVVDDTDIPSALLCNTPSCSGGNKVYTPTPGVVCGPNNEKCSMSGACGCQSNADCTLPQTCGGGGMPLYCGCTPKMCLGAGGLGKTCGGPFSDACGAMIGCNNGMKDGTETDVDCGGVAAAGSTCATACANGLKCIVGTDCQSGFCADGVCCNSACTGAGFICQACSAAAKGQGMNGVCGAVKAPLDPHNQCPAGTKASCKDAGGCNGSGACALWPSGTICLAAVCTNATTLQNAETCNGSGTCSMPPTTQDCTPYLCAGGACTSTCSNDGQCAATAYCNIASHTCLPKLATGTGTCSANDQCTSNACGTNGTCCTATCTPAPPCGQTGACAAGTGACVLAPSGTACGMSSCMNGQITAAGSCNGSGSCGAGGTMACPGGFVCANGSSCKTACGGDPDCQGNSNFCANPGASGTCIAKGAPGAACSAADQCTSNVCGSNSVCCTMSCAPGMGACANTGCASGTGACTYPASGTACGSTCSAGNLTSSTCDAMGNCNAGGPMMCGGNLACSGNMCGSSCTTGTSTGCVSGSYTCVGGTMCGLADGQSCTPPTGGCASGICFGAANAHCCAAGGCVTGGTCGATSCNASGACVYPGGGTNCGSACANGFLTNSTCNMAGGCVAGSPNVCPGNRACMDASTCLTSGSCGSNDPAGDANCAQGFYCDGTACQALQASGAGSSCTRNGQCISMDCCTNGPCTHGQCN